MPRQAKKAGARKAVTAPRPRGRPSLYETRHCDAMIAFCREGYSITAYAGEIGVSRECLSEWGRVHPDFSVALKVAKAVSARWWEERGRKVGERGGGPGTATMITFALRNMAQDDFADRQHLEHTGKDGGPIQSVSLMTNDPLEAARVYQRIMNGG